MKLLSTQKLKCHYQAPQSHYRNSYIYEMLVFSYIILLTLSWLYAKVYKSCHRILKEGSKQERLLIYTLLFLPIVMLCFFTSLFIMNVDEIISTWIGYYALINFSIAIASVALASRTRKILNWHTVILLANLAVIAIYISIGAILIMFGQW